MTIALTGATVDTGVPAQNVRPQATPVISTAGNDPQSIARQQTPSAVPAPALLAAYSTGIAPQKPPAKPLSSSPSSSFAAQFIAQDAGTQDDLALFTPPKAAVTTETPADDYLADLRIARGDFSALDKTAPTQASEEADASDAVQEEKPAVAAAGETTARAGLTQTASTLPSVFSHLSRRANTIAQTKGVGAYQLAQTRNAMLKRIAEPATEAVAEPVS